jgi:hypothetical protein
MREEANITQRVRGDDTVNIFKVLASGRKSFQEETASAILAWLMNPAMEHGLGSILLAEFVRDLSGGSTCPSEFKALPGRLTPRLRNENEDVPICRCALEYNVGTGFIDIVFFIDQWMLSIENKIYAASIGDTQQLAKQYQGLKERHPDLRACSVFLVPIEGGPEVPDPLVEETFGNLSVAPGDFKQIVTWQENGRNGAPSISGLLQRILTQESTGRIDPVPEYTRHTLKALVAFIESGFEGYEYNPAVSGGGLNDATERQLTVAEILQRDEGFVGVKAGVSGLLQMPIDIMTRHRFQYTSLDMSTKRNWIPVKQFRRLVAWRRGDRPDIAWEGTLPSAVLHKIAGDYGAKVFIGIKGGEAALRAMPVETIHEKQWQISTQQPTPQWVAGDTFARILEQKGKLSIVSQTAA